MKAGGVRTGWTSTEQVGRKYGTAFTEENQEVSGTGGGVPIFHLVRRHGAGVWGTRKCQDWIRS